MLCIRFQAFKQRKSLKKDLFITNMKQMKCKKSGTRCKIISVKNL